MLASFRNNDAQEYTRSAAELRRRQLRARCCVRFSISILSRRSRACHTRARRSPELLLFFPAQTAGELASVARFSPDFIIPRARRLLSLSACRRGYTPSTYTCRNRGLPLGTKKRRKKYTRGESARDSFRCVARRNKRSVGARAFLNGGEGPKIPAIKFASTIARQINKKKIEEKTGGLEHSRDLPADRFGSGKKRRGAERSPALTACTESARARARPVTSHSRRATSPA